MSPVNHDFFIRGDDGEEYGPVGLDELREWVHENRAGLGTVVRLDEPDALWQPWQYYPELVALLAEAQAMNLVPAQAIAPLRKRILASMVDIILAYLLMVPILSVVTLLYQPDWYIQIMVALIRSENPLPQPPLQYVVLVAIILYLGITLYMAGFHAAHGRTPAKSLLRLKVVDQTGQKPTFVKAFLRGLVMAFSLYSYGIPLAYASLVCAFFDPQRRALHDFVAGTYVVEA